MRAKQWKEYVVTFADGRKKTMMAKDRRDLDERAMRDATKEHKDWRILSAVPTGRTLYA